MSSRGKIMTKTPDQENLALKSIEILFRKRKKSTGPFLKKLKRNVKN
ncbi:MAG: hypothetical protein ACTSRB_16855 [Candidatus Helarchaeota archaeon]